MRGVRVLYVERGIGIEGVGGGMRMSALFYHVE